MRTESAAHEALLFFTPEWNGMHPGAWRLPDAPVDGALDFDHVRGLVARAEAAKMHAFFLADALGFRLEVGLDSLSKTAAAARYEPFTLMAALATTTDRIGLIMTANTTYDEPYHVARRFSSLDHLSRGRAGWNIVTGGFSSGSVHFGRAENIPHDQRYARAQEFVDSVVGLWDGWGDDAFIRDKQEGRFFDPSQMHVFEATSPAFPIRGPLNIPRPLQGHPVLAQAGSSPAGKEFAARYAEVVFTLQPDIGRARTFRSEMRDRAAAGGRDPDQVKVMPSLTLTLGSSQADAEQKMKLMNELAGPQVGIELLAGFLETPLSLEDWDRALPDVRPTTTGTTTIQQFFVNQARNNGLLVKDLVGLALGFGAVTTTAAAAADRIEEWIVEGAADGFNITFTENGETMDLFLGTVIPELRRRGIFQTEYAGSTLREVLGLARPMTAHPE